MLKNTLHAPGIRRKLISINAATSTDILGKIDSNEMTLERSGTVLLTGVKRNGLYFARATNVNEASDINLEVGVHDDPV